MKTMVPREILSALLVAGMMVAAELDDTSTPSSSSRRIKRITATEGLTTVWVTAAEMTETVVPSVPIVEAPTAAAWSGPTTLSFTSDGKVTIMNEPLRTVIPSVTNTPTSFVHMTADSAVATEAAARGDENGKKGRDGQVEMEEGAEPAGPLVLVTATFPTLTLTATASSHLQLEAIPPSLIDSIGPANYKTSTVSGSIGPSSSSTAASNSRGTIGPGLAKVAPWLAAVFVCATVVGFSVVVFT